MNEVEARCQLVQSRAKLGAARGNIGEQFFVLYNREEFERRRADERAAAERGAVHSGSQRRGELLAGNERAEREAACKGLCDGDNIGQRAELLVGEFAAGTAQAALNFVGDQRGVVLSGECPSPLPEFPADREDAALALNRLDHDGANSVVEFRLEVRDVVEADKLRAGDE